MTARFFATVTDSRIAASLIAFAMLIGISPVSQNAVGQEPDAKQEEAPKSEGGETPETELSMEDVSYVIGVQIGQNMVNAKIELDLESFNKGLKAVLDGADLKMTDEEMEKILNAFGQVQQAKQMEEMEKQMKENEAAGTAFLEKNKKKEGVKTTDSGLQYRVIKAGDGKGKQPSAEDSVTVHYKGTFMDGEVFDSSIATGQPATFEANRVISGWTEALQLMREGDKWELVLPSKLAYGERGNQRIPPNSILIFEVELIKVNDAKE